MDKDKLSEYVTAAELSKILGITKNGLAQQRVRRSGFPYYKWGGKIWYHLPEVLALMEKSRVDTNPL